MALLTCRRTDCLNFEMMYFFDMATIAPGDFQNDVSILKVKKIFFLDTEFNRVTVVISFFSSSKYLEFVQYLPFVCRIP